MARRNDEAYCRNTSMYDRTLSEFWRGDGTILPYGPATWPFCPIGLAFDGMFPLRGGICPAYCGSAGCGISCIWFRLFGTDSV